MCFYWNKVKRKKERVWLNKYLFTFYKGKVLLFLFFSLPTFLGLPPSVRSWSGQDILHSVGQLTVGVPGVTWTTLHPSLRNKTKQKPTRNSVTGAFLKSYFVIFAACTCMNGIVSLSVTQQHVCLELTHGPEADFQISLFASLPWQEDKLYRSHSGQRSRKSICLRWKPDDWEASLLCIMIHSGPYAGTSSRMFS